MNIDISLVNIVLQKSNGITVSSSFWMMTNEVKKLRKLPNCTIKAAKLPIHTAEAALKEMGITEN